MRETSEAKNWLIEDLLVRAEEEIARDQEADDLRTRKQQARDAEVRRMRQEEEKEAEMEK